MGNIELVDVIHVMKAVGVAAEGASKGMGRGSAEDAARHYHCVGMSLLGAFGILNMEGYISPLDAVNGMKKLAVALDCGSAEDMSELCSIFGIQDPLTG